MAEIKPTPRNETLWRIAQALNRTRGFLNPAPGTPLHDVEWFRPGNLLMAAAPEEVRELAYGNSPFAAKPLGDRLPQPKRTTWERMDTGERETVNRALSSLDSVLAAPAELAARGAVAGAPLAVGAIRRAGVPGAVASHTTPATTMLKHGEEIARNGLFAPSLGLTYKAPSDYHSKSPHYVFKADEVDKPLPDQAPSGIWNRDAFVWNPSISWWKADPEGHGSVRNQWAHSNFFNPQYNSGDAIMRRIWKDARLTQMSPGPSHTASILASPAFPDLKAWEDSPYGLGALRSMREELGLKADSTHNYDWEFRQLLRQLGIGPADQYENLEPSRGPLRDILEVFPALTSLTQRNPSLVDWTQPASRVFQTARDAPSDMAEVKLYAPQVPAGPDSARIFLPNEDSEVRRQMERLGYDVWSAPQLDRYTEALGQEAPSGSRIDLLAPNIEGSMPKPREFDLKGSSMVAQPAWPPGIDKPLTGMAGQTISFDDALKLAGKPEKASELPDLLPDLLPPTAFTGWKEPAYHADHPTLWKDTLEWFQGNDSTGTLAAHLGAKHGLTKEQIDVLDNMWFTLGANSSGKGVAEAMQSIITLWKTSGTGK